MLKKIVLTFILTSGITAILVSCCGNSKEYWVMTDFTTQFYDASLQSVIGDSTNIDSLSINILAEKQFVNQNELDFLSLFVSPTYAFQCPNPGENGLKYSLVDVIITSNKDFNQYTAGQNISSICTINNQSVSQFINFEWHSFSSPDITISQKPSQQVIRNFTITFVFDNGSTVSNTTNSIVWY